MAEVSREASATGSAASAAAGTGSAASLISAGSAARRAARVGAAAAAAAGARRMGWARVVKARALAPSALSSSSARAFHIERRAAGGRATQATQKITCMVTPPLNVNGVYLTQKINVRRVTQNAGLTNTKYTYFKNTIKIQYNT